MTRPRVPLSAYGVFAALLAAAGLPIYIHAPKFYVDEYGVSLAAMGAILFGLRLLDVVQDPLLGYAAGALRKWRGICVAGTVAVMAICMICLFAIVPPVAPMLWFAVMLAGVFSAFSFLTIIFYAQGVQAAPRLGWNGYLRLARWRETGALLGVCAAAVAPVALGGFDWFAVSFAVFAVLAVVLMRGQWQASAQPENGIAPVLRDPVARRLLLIALVNAAPVAVTSTLFLFFVESRLGAPTLAGPFLLLFFLSAAAAAPVWGYLAAAHGARRILIVAMCLSIIAFGFAITLQTGDVWAFGLICLASGAATGADMTLLPALFAQRMEDVAPGASGAFGLWSFVSKFTLAMAALVVLPLLEVAGFVPGDTNDPGALLALSLSYGLLPCLLKLLAIGLLASTRWRQAAVHGSVEASGG